MLQYDRQPIGARLYAVDIISVFGHFSSTCTLRKQRQSALLASDFVSNRCTAARTLASADITIAYVDPATIAESCVCLL